MDTSVKEAEKAAAQRAAAENAAIEPPPLPRRPPSFGTRLIRSGPIQNALAGFAAGYLRFVHRSSRFAFDPPDAYGRYTSYAPLIFTMWHGQHFMLPFARIFDYDVRVLISRHHDGELNALVARKLGIGAIRGSTARNPSRMMAKGGMVGFLEMKAALEEGACVSMTADISNLAPRRAGLGIVKLAQASGRPIIPIAYASSRRLEIKSWDRATVNLPFSRAVCSVAEPITVSPEADAAELEEKRLAVQAALDEATRRAYELVDRRAG